MQPNPYRIFWDLEMLTEKLTSEEKTKLTHIKRLQMHKSCGYYYVVVHMDSSLNYEIISQDLYRGLEKSQIIIIKVICKISIKFCILNDKVICQREYFEQRLYVKIE